ncbi:MAG TPA: hypothetical protein VF133_12640 [Terriglobales bacterium]
MPEAGFAGKKNGELLQLAEEADLDALITLDQGIEYQQNLRPRKQAMVVIRSKSSRLRDLLPHVPRILDLFKPLHAGQLARVPG